MADLRISELAALVGADLAAGDLLPIVDLSASETKKITVTDFLGNAVTLLADNTIPAGKLIFNNNTIPGAAITDSSITPTQLADDAVTAAKMADSSSVQFVATLPASGAFIGQLAVDIATLATYAWNGSTWQSIKAAGSINTVVGGSTGIVNITVTQTGDAVTINTTLDNTTAAAQFLAGPSGSAGAVSYRLIAAADLPTATSSLQQLLPARLVRSTQAVASALAPAANSTTATPQRLARTPRSQSTAKGMSQQAAACKQLTFQTSIHPF
ncbi:hypothetical protein EBT31_16630 [bacterium]|nr:hypothetical protein [bacterium]